MRENTKDLGKPVGSLRISINVCRKETQYNFYQVFQANARIPDSSDDEGCNDRRRMSYFTLPDTLEPGDDSAPSDTRGKDEVKPLYAFPIWLPHLRQRSFVVRRNKPHECL